MPAISRLDFCNSAKLLKALQEKIAINQIKYIFLLTLDAGAKRKSASGWFDPKGRIQYREFL